MFQPTTAKVTQAHRSQGFLGDCFGALQSEYDVGSGRDSMGNWQWIARQNYDVVHLCACLTIERPGVLQDDTKALIEDLTMQSCRYLLQVNDWSSYITVALVPLYLNGHFMFIETFYADAPFVDDTP